MSRNFSTQLVETCIEYFKRKHGVDISADTANEYLHSFAKLYLAFARPNGGNLADGTSVPCETAVAEKTGSRSIGVSNTYGTL
jgi:hypothetical protein